LFRYKLTIEYKGSRYIGWQKQAKDANSIQEIIEKAIFKLTGEEVELAGSGRTDAGVHAIAQMAHFDLQKEKSAFKMRPGLNHYLQEEDIVILDCKQVDENFHSRFDAVMRHYQYRIINRHPQPAIDKGLAWHVANPLDVGAMIEASKYLIGKHDFSSFRDSECQAKSPVKTIDKITIYKEDELIKIEISAKSFLHHQVRNMVGTLAYVGEGKIKAQEMEKILQARDRKKSGPNAPAEGLYFLGVEY
jgi:tRNA pseudouridine38-40 synthase